MVISPRVSKIFDFQLLLSKVKNQISQLNISKLSPFRIFLNIHHKTRKLMLFSEIHDYPLKSRFFLGSEL